MFWPKKALTWIIYKLFIITFKLNIWALKIYINYEYSIKIYEMEFYGQYGVWKMDNKNQ